MVTGEEIIYFKNAGRMKKNLIWVESNVMDIPMRVREIDAGYFIMFNPDRQQFEVHHKEQDYTLALNVPYDGLDVRTLKLVNDTKIENAARIMAEIDAHNERLEKDRADKESNEIQCKLGDMYDYCSSHESKETLDKGAYSTRFV